MSRVVVFMIIAWASAGCVAGDDDPPSQGSTLGPTLDCRARSDRAFPSDGCYCEMLAPGMMPSNTFPKVQHCNDTYAGTGKTTCCKTSRDCLCLSIGCHRSSVTDRCVCGVDQGSAILVTESVTLECMPPTGGRCCSSPAGGTCGCDTLGPKCPVETGDLDVPSCNATPTPPACAEGVMVSACN